MKFLIFSLLLLLSLTSLSRDFTHNARRDIVNPMFERAARLSKLSKEEYAAYTRQRQANILKHKDFHDQLKRADNRGEESQR